MEYQLHRPGDALACFLHLTELPPATEDLLEIIDKAGSFLLDVPDLCRARELYTAAAAAFRTTPFLCRLSAIVRRSRETPSRLSHAPGKRRRLGRVNK